MLTRCNCSHTLKVFKKNNSLCSSPQLIDLLMRVVLEPNEVIINTPPTFGMYSFDCAVTGNLIRPELLLVSSTSVFMSPPILTSLLAPLFSLGHLRMVARSSMSQDSGLQISKSTLKAYEMQSCTTNRSCFSLLLRTTRTEAPWQIQILTHYSSYQSSLCLTRRTLSSA